MRTTLQAVDYAKFRQVINQQASHHIHQSRDMTLLYDTKYRVIAAMRAASIGHNGRCKPVHYYISA